MLNLVPNGCLALPGIKEIENAIHDLPLPSAGALHTPRSRGDDSSITRTAKQG
jgi:hypothetical protein